MKYCPDRWIVVIITTPTESWKRVFSGAYGGYGGSDTWRMSSPIVSETREGNALTFITESGSEYQCHLGAYGMSGYMNAVFDNYAERNSEKVSLLIDETYKDMALKYEKL